MALIKKIELENNFGELSTFEKSYIKIESLNGDKNNINLNVSFYSNIDNKRFLKATNVSFIPTLDKNFIEQGYEYLKTLEEFKDAKDV